MKTCAEDGCITRLSSYNDEDKCFLHQLPHWASQARWLRQRRAEELEGKHPEDLRWSDGVPVPLALRDNVPPIWDDMLRARVVAREPRDLMEA